MKRKISPFARRLKEIRKRLKIKQDDFCSRMDISKTNLSKIENGKSKPGHDFFFSIGKVFNVNPNYLLFGEGPMFRTGEQDKEPPLSLYTECDEYNPQIREFLDNFFNSKYLNHRILAEYTKIYTENADYIEKEIAQKKARAGKGTPNTDH